MAFNPINPLCHKIMQSVSVKRVECISLPVNLLSVTGHIWSVYVFHVWQQLRAFRFTSALTDASGSIFHRRSLQQLLLQIISGPAAGSSSSNNDDCSVSHAPLSLGEGDAAAKKAHAPIHWRSASAFLMSREVHTCAVIRRIIISKETEGEAASFRVHLLWADSCGTSRAGKFRKYYFWLIIHRNSGLIIIFINLFKFLWLIFKVAWQLANFTLTCLWDLLY